MLKWKSWKHITREGKCEMPWEEKLPHSTVSIIIKDKSRILEAAKGTVNVMYHFNKEREKRPIHEKSEAFNDVGGWSNQQEYSSVCLQFKVHSLFNNLREQDDKYKNTFNTTKPTRLVSSIQKLINLHIQITKEAASSNFEVGKI